MSYTTDNKHGDFMRHLAVLFQAIRANDRNEIGVRATAILKLKANTDLEKTVRLTLGSIMTALYLGAPLSLNIEKRFVKTINSKKVMLTPGNPELTPFTVNLIANMEVYDWLLNVIEQPISLPDNVEMINADA